MEKVKGDVTNNLSKDIDELKHGQNQLAAKDEDFNDRILNNLEKLINLEESYNIQQQKAKFVDTLNERSEQNRLL